MNLKVGAAAVTPVLIGRRRYRGRGVGMEGCSISWESVGTTSAVGALLAGRVTLGEPWMVRERLTPQQSQTGSRSGSGTTVTPPDLTNDRIKR